MTQVTATVDFGATGKQSGWLRVPHSVTRSAYGVIPVPITLFRNGDGPSILLTAGTHGDEYEGQVVLTRLVQRLQAEDIRGTLIVIPALNAPAAIAGTRVSPLDGGNLNREYPGDPNGGPTAKIADYMTTRIVPMVDVVGDFHGGGASLAYRPHASTQYHPDADPDLKRRSLDAVCALGVPHVMVLESAVRSGGMSTATKDQGKIYLNGEYGGMGSVTRSGIALVDRAVRGLLAHFGATEDRIPEAPPPEVLRLFGHVYAPEPGVFVPATGLGQVVNAGDLCGEVVFPETPQRPPEEVRFDASGVVVCQRHPARVERGDCVAHLAAPVDR